MEIMSAAEAGEGSKTKDHLSIDIKQEGVDLVSSIKLKLEAVSSSNSIFRVPLRLLKGNERLYYHPDKVSIGPFHHHGKEALKAIEDQKWLYLNTLLSRKPNLEVTLDSCIKALREVEQRARACYAEEIKFTSDEFVEMMLIDGCFLIELFLKYAFKGLRQRNDPIFTIPGMLFDVRYNLVLLENQIPLFILLRLFQIVPIPRQCTQSVNELAFRFFKSMLPGDEEHNSDKFNRQGYHLLDLIHQCYIPTFPKPKYAHEGTSLIDTCQYCATKLDEARIDFKKVTDKSLLDIMVFDEDGVMEIPQLKTPLFTEKLFANLIAYEQSHCEEQYFTSYGFLMGILIQSESDFELLRSRKILMDDLDKMREILHVFNKLCKEENMKEFYFAGLFKLISEYRTKRKGSSWKIWKHRYYNSPLSCMVCVVAILVVVVIFVGISFGILYLTVHYI